MKAIVAVCLLLCVCACSRSDMGEMAKIVKETDPQATKCQSERKQVDVAKQVLEAEEGLAAGTPVSMQQLERYMGHKPACPTGTINPGRMGEPVTCSKHNK